RSLSAAASSTSTPPRSTAPSASTSSATRSNPSASSTPKRSAAVHRSTTPCSSPSPRPQSQKNFSPPSTPASPAPAPQAQPSKVAKNPSNYRLTSKARVPHPFPSHRKGWESRILTPPRPPSSPVGSSSPPSPEPLSP